MKKKFVLLLSILTVALLLMLTGCNQDSHSSPNSNSGINTTSVESNACTHKWKNATCTSPQICEYCNETTGEPLEHTWIAATCTSPKTCSVCNLTNGNVSDHTFVNGYCSLCSEPDKNSDEYKYDFLKKKSDGIAFSCAETVVRNMLKNPSTMEVLGEEILDSDDYFRYYIKINYTAQNNLGGTVTGTAYVLIRVNPEMDGTFYHTYNKTLGIKYSISENEKAVWGWDTKPSDWSLEAANKYITPVEVSLKLLLANPNQYKGQYVKIKDQLVISYNLLSDRVFKTYLSTGDGKYDYNSSNSIYVYYRMSDNVDNCIMLDADYQKITVIGEVKIFSDSREPYIDAYEIIFE